MAKKKKTITPEQPKLFEKFWQKYAMKVDRIAAVRAWNKLDKDLRREAIDGIQHYRDVCDSLGAKRMWPQGYLNHRRWEDEADKPQEKVSSATIQASSNGTQPNLKPETCQPDTPPDNLPDMAIW